MKTSLYYYITTPERTVHVVNICDKGVT